MEGSTRNDRCRTGKAVRVVRQIDGIAGNFKIATTFDETRERIAVGFICTVAIHNERLVAQNLNPGELVVHHEIFFIGSLSARLFELNAVNPFRNRTVLCLLSARLNNVEANRIVF